MRDLAERKRKIDLYSDASTTGWGAKVNTKSTYGHWDHREVEHINVLELNAIKYGLKSLCSRYKNVNICIHTDNTTAKACIDRAGSNKPRLLEITKEIFHWAGYRDVTLSCKYIEGKKNIHADKPSRITNFDSEWAIQPQIFSEICDIFNEPSIDLFGTRINAKTPKYVSWLPDPYAEHYDAFTIYWKDELMYAFPPFSITGRVLQKVRRDEATLILILPIWPTAPWWTLALQLLADHPKVLPQNSLYLPQKPGARHPLHPLQLAAMLLSGKDCLRMKYQRKLPTFSYPNGESPHGGHMPNTSRNGLTFVNKNKLIRFTHL